MFYEIFRFELKYRLKRPETYLFFVFLFAFSIFGVDFIFQGVEIGLVKMNAPIIIGKTMGALTGIFMILASMIMGMPIIRDDQHLITPLIYSNPIRKIDFLFGRFFGSFLILLIIFCGIPLGMMLGEFLPWRLEEEMLSFRFIPYISVFTIIVLPTLIFGASLFFVSGMLSRKLLVVYTQGIFLFVIFLLTKAITNEYLQGVLDPFSLTTTTQLVKEWTFVQKNTMLLPFSGILIVNKLFWMGFGGLILWYGYQKFNFTVISKSRNSSKLKSGNDSRHGVIDTGFPQVSPKYDLRSQLIQFILMSIFYCKSLLKETSFWSIVICAVIIIIINSISLGTVYGVDSYPTTYFIVEELQEMSMYFFIIIMLFYSAELYGKEKGVRMNLMSDATPISSLVRLASKALGLIGIYIVLILSLIISGIIFQITKGYYHFDLDVYFTGFFIEILPFLILYTMASFAIHALVNNKILGILLSLFFIIVTLILEPLGINNILLTFGGSGLEVYSEMNGYGHFMASYLWTKIYWLLVGSLLFIFASLISARGIDFGLRYRYKKIKSNLSLKIKVLAMIVFLFIVFAGAYIFYQTHVLNETWNIGKQQSYRANYEKSLKQFEYMPQPTIYDVNLNVELYPENQSYELIGEYAMMNAGNESIHEIHIQKLIDSDIKLENVGFSETFTVDSQYQIFEYIIYNLDKPLLAGESITMHFNQTLKPKGFNSGSSISSVQGNGTFIHNNEFPTLGYNRKYEMSEESDRKKYGLANSPLKAPLDDINALRVARSGSDSHGLKTHVIIGTSGDQTGITSGRLVKKWEEVDRNYFEYKTDESMIDFYSINSGEYEVLQDTWYSVNQVNNPVDLEIYYHPRHSYNLERMMNGIRASLNYYTSQFSPYQYDQLRIVEFPRYEDFAQSLPSTIPFSESIGFMLDINDSTDVDMTFFVTAHEVAHQWWGMQVEAANVKGRNFLLETLSQYSALMVFKKQFSKEKVDQFLVLQKELYNKGKNKAKVAEVPLYLVENEDYIYYNKGLIVMNELQGLIGEEHVNSALRSFIEDWNSKEGRIKCKTDRYATSEDLISYILDESPEGKRDEVKKMLMEVDINFGILDR